MTRDELLAMMAPFSDEEFVVRRLFDTIPFVFGGDTNGFTTWRGEVAAPLRARADHVFIVGSGATGFSLAPEHPGRGFRSPSLAEKPSDLDLAVVSDSLFVEAWETILRFDRRRALRVSKEDVERIRRYIYFGAVFSYHIPRDTPPARSMLIAIAATTRHARLRGHPATVKLYRTYDDLLAYQAFSIKNLRRELTPPGRVPL